MLTGWPHKVASVRFGWLFRAQPGRRQFRFCSCQCIDIAGLPELGFGLRYQLKKFRSNVWNWFLSSMPADVRQHNSHMLVFAVFASAIQELLLRIVGVALSVRLEFS